MKRTLPHWGTACAVLFAVSAAHAAPQAAPKPLHLPASTLSQIAALEHEADTRTPAQQKISSQLVYALKMARGEQIAPGITTLRTTAVIDGRGMTLVDMDATPTPDLIYAITRTGGTVVNTSERFGAVRANVPLASLETLAMVPGVRWIKPAVMVQPQNPAPLSHAKRADFLAPFVLPVPERMSRTQKAASVRLNLPGLLARVGATVPGPQASAIGSVTDEADKTHRADLARSTFHVDGTGIKVGVISDSLDDGNGVYADAVSSGDVSKVTVISGQSGGNGSAEGLAMLEDVHHLAPGAQLYFATGNGGDAKFADNIIALQKAGCKVIVDDLFSGDDPPFQDGVISQAVNTVTAAGVMYFSCTANYGHAGANTASVWEGDFKDSGDTSFGDGHIHTFDSSQGVDGEGNPVQIPSPDGKTAGTSVAALFWSDPLGKSSNDYDLLVLDSGFHVVAASTDRQTGSQDPIEAAKVTNGDYVDIVRHSGSTRFLHLDLLSQNSIFGFITNGRVRGHNATANAFCIAATPAAKNQDGDTQGPYPNPFNSSDVVETFSSDGPRRVFFNPDGSAITSSLTHTGGKILNKPDFTAADGTRNTLTANEVGTNPDTGDPNEVLSPFFGTSCATPHAGAIAALALSRNKTLTRSQLATILDKSVTDIMDTGYDYDAGYGILDAYKAVQNTPVSSTVALSALAVSPTSVTGGKTSTGTVTLSASAPSGGTKVTLKSSSTGTATVPSSVTVASGSKTATFTITSKPVSSNKTVTITATLGSVSKTASLKVNVPTTSKLAFSPLSISSDSQTTGTVTISGPAPSGGSAVDISYQGSSIITVTVPAGQTSTTFTLNFFPVSSTTTFQIDAILNGVTKSATVTVKPTSVVLSKLSVSPSTVTSGSTTLVTVTLTANAPAGGAVVEIFQDSTDLGYLLIAEGQKTASFNYAPPSVTSTKKSTMKATYNNSSKTASLTVKP